MVRGQHAQKVHSGETVGANHRSRFHSEVRVSHQVSHPTGNAGGPMGFPTDGNLGNQSRFGRQNSRPVKVTTHQWPAITQFNQEPLQSAPSHNMPRMHFSEEMKFPSHGFGMGPGQPGVQRFFAPPLNPHPEIIHPGFQRFFESIKNFGPHQSAHPLTDASNSESGEKRLAIEDSTSSKQVVPKIESSSDNLSESSSIRSSASAYWPPELKFSSAEGETPTKYGKPMMMLRRKSPNDGHERHQQLRIIN